MQPGPDPRFVDQLGVIVQAGTVVQKAFYRC
jgi:hypothetical protein